MKAALPSHEMKALAIELAAAMPPEQQTLDSGKLKEVKDALGVAVNCLWDCNAVLDLLRDEQTMSEADFPEAIAGSIRMIHERIARTVKQVETAI